MNSSSDIGGMIDQLDENLDNLQDALKTILSKSLGELASDYPVLDRAKLYILVTYAIESAIFSFLRLTGTSAREHPIYRELERVKQYFQKAKLAETSLQKPAMRLDQAAASRFIKAALAGNEVSAKKPVVTADTKSDNHSIALNDKIPSNSRKRKLDSARQKSPKPNALQPDLNGSSDGSGEVNQTLSKSKNSNTDLLMTESSNTDGQPPPPTGTTSSADPASQTSNTKKERRDRYRASARAKKRSAAESTGGEESAALEPAKKKLKDTKEVKKAKKSKNEKAEK